jgi:MFS family permease
MTRNLLRSAIPAGREMRRFLLGTLFSALGQGLTVPFLLVYLTKVRGLNAGAVGVLVAVTAAVGLAMTPVGGWLVDRFGARRVSLPLLLMVSAGTFTLAFVDSAWTALAALVAVAGSTAPMWSAGGTMLATLVPDQERQRAFGLNFTLLNLGIGAGGLIAGSFVNVAHPVTFQILYVGDALSYLVPFAVFLSMPTMGRRVVTEPAQLSKARGVASPALRRRGGGYRQVFGDRAFRTYFVFGLILATIGYAQIEVGFTGFAINASHVSARVIGWAFAANTFLIVVAQLFVLRWLEGRSRSRALALVGLVFAGSWSTLALSGVAGGAGYGGAAAVGVIACSTIFAAGETVMSPVLPALTNALATDELRGRYNAVSSTASGLSGVIGPITAGPLIGAGHPFLWYSLVVAGSLSVTVMALRLHRLLTPAQDGRVPNSPAAAPAIAVGHDVPAPAQP